MSETKSVQTRSGPVCLSLPAWWIAMELERRADMYSKIKAELALIHEELEAIKKARREYLETGVPQAQSPTLPMPVPGIVMIRGPLEGCDVEAFSRRPYVMVKATHPVKGTVLGIAKVSHGDRWDANKGLELALTRAAREMGRRQ